jgi:hypothetical protein
MNKEQIARLKEVQDKVDKKIIELDNELRTLKFCSLRNRITRFLLKSWMWILGYNGDSNDQRGD